MPERNVRIKDFFENYIKFLLVNGHHPNVKQMTELGNCNRLTVFRWLDVIHQLGWAELVRVGSRRVLIIPSVHFIDDRVHCTYCNHDVHQEFVGTQTFTPILSKVRDIPLFRCTTCGKTRSIPKVK